jgi:hypothetical protein
MENAERKPLGIIDALSAGFDLVIHRPWILILPVALDLFLWIGPQARAKPVFDQVIAVLNVSAAQNSTPDAQASFEMVRAALQAAGEHFNLFSYVALFGIGMPTLAGVDMPVGFVPPLTLSIGDELSLLSWMVLSVIVGVLLGSIYLEGIARHVRGDQGGARTFVPRVLKSYATVLWLGTLLVGGALLLALPFLTGAVLVSYLSPGLALIVLLAVLLIYVSLLLYLAFAVPSVFVSGSGATQAIANSISILRYNFWSAIGLIFLIALLEMGFSVIWQELVGSPWGVVLVFVLSAFLGTGLVAGGMMFYYDRIAWLTEVRRRIHQHPRPLIKG